MSAVLSDCGRYRYRLERSIAPAGKTAAIIMVNPSTADAMTDDHSIRKWKGFGVRFGFKRLLVGNKFAFRATDIKALRTAVDPIGPDNDNHLRQILGMSDIHIVAWGSLNKLPSLLRVRWKRVVEIADEFGCELYCLGTAQDGHPLHPLMRPYDSHLVRWHPTI